ncbi:MAG: hypothetical protein HZB33_04065 [Nitrospirae bacterium]|nr:hypothetical protein [Nitrospirota bacterium]
MTAYTEKYAVHPKYKLEEAMKTGRMSRNITALALGITFVFFSLSPAAQASVYLGQFCWQSNLDGTIYTFAVNNMGDDHFLINGTSEPSGGGVIPVTGNAEIAVDAGNDVLAMSFSGGSFGSSGTQTYSLNWSIDLNTGDGIGMGNLTRTDNLAQSTIFLVEDSLSFIVCP